MKSASTVSLSPQTIQAVKASMLRFEECSNQIVLKFYETMFDRYPLMKHQFNMDRQKGGKSEIAGVPAQVASLANFVIRFAKTIDNIESFGPAIERVAHKHVSRAVRKEQYNAVAESFLYAIKFILGNDATSEIMKAWEEVFTFLAKVFTTTEDKIKEELSERAGFAEFVDMYVTKVVDLDNGMKGIHVLPKDYPVPPHLPGQYVAVRVKNLEGEDMMCTAPLQETTENCLCMKIRRSEEEASLFLLQSVVIGSVLQVSMPCGKGKRAISTHASY